MKSTTRFYAGALALLFIAGALIAPVSARASEDGRRNTMLGLGALTGYLFTRGGSKVPAFLGLAGTAYAYKRYNDSVSARHRRQRWYNSRRNYRSYRSYRHYRR